MDEVTLYKHLNALDQRERDRIGLQDGPNAPLLRRHGLIPTPEWEALEDAMWLRGEAVRLGADFVVHNQRAAELDQVVQTLVRSQTVVRRATADRVAAFQQLYEQFAPVALSRFDAVVERSGLAAAQEILASRPDEFAPIANELFVAQAREDTAALVRSTERAVAAAETLTELAARQSQLLAEAIEHVPNETGRPLATPAELIAAAKEAAAAERGAARKLRQGIADLGPDVRGASISARFRALDPHEARRAAERWPDLSQLVGGRTREIPDALEPQPETALTRG